MLAIEIVLSIEILLLLFQVGFGVENLPGGDVQQSLVIGRIDLKQHVSSFHLLVVADRDVNNRAGNARRNSNYIRANLRVPGPRIFHIPLIKRPRSPSGQANDDEGNQIIKKPRLHGKQTIPMMLLSRITNATKNSGRCQTWRARPVRSIIAITNQAARKPDVPTTKIQGKSRSINLNSGRFIASKTIIKQTTSWMVAEFLCCLNGRSHRMRLSQGRRFMSPLPQAIHIEVNDRRCVEGQHLRHGQTADDRDPEWLADF